MQSKFQRRRRWILAALAAAISAAFLVIIPVANAAPDRTDVYMSDNIGDTGSIPSSDPIYWSPDVLVCPNTSLFPCATDVPVTLGQTYFVFVTLHNPGPNAPANPASGQLSLYASPSGGASTWNNPPWQPTGLPIAATVPVGGTQLMFTWTVPTSVPAGEHFCLLAVWTSSTDPLTYPMIPGQPMDPIIRNNNNVVQHNVTVADGGVGQHIVVPFTLRNPYQGADRAGLTIVPSGHPFIGPGSLVIDLGTVLGPRWAQTGALGSGVKQVGPTQVQIMDPTQARIFGLPLNPGDEFRLSLDFFGGPAASGNQYTEDVYQTDSQGRNDGGVEYRIAIK